MALGKPIGTSSNTPDSLIVECRNVDVSNFQLTDDAPKRLRTLARPSQLVAVKRLGYEITVGDKTSRTIDAKFKETTSAGGQLTIFGIHIRLGGSGSHESENNTHDAKWDASTKTLKVVPKDDYGTATIVGIVGEKLNIL